MLTGRESLARIVGRPRRYLPNRHSILSSSVADEATTSSSKGFFNICEEDEKQKNDSLEERFALCEEDASHREDSVEEISDSAAEMVNCPVCGCSFPGQDNSVINIHLDECIAGGGRKRKLSQLTLLQFNYSTSRVKVQPLHPDETACQQHLPIDPDIIGFCSKTPKKQETDTSKACESLPKTSSFTNAGKDPFINSIETTCSNHVSNDEFSSPIKLLESSKFVTDDCLDELNLSEVSIPTIIVGRRFSQREELDLKSSICLIRDFENVKDPNAIKVTYKDCNNNNILGYLPRDMAQYLSPLMDKYDFLFEGRITSIPKDSRAAVPIQIVCIKGQSFDTKDCENGQDIKSLWQHVQNAAELAKMRPTGIISYQQNMAMIIVEVLKSSPHVFTVMEKSFLESFKSLSDNSQRLFARLYTRKGPWFRVSSILYSEISDLGKAVDELNEAGYLCSISLRKKIDKNDLENILNVLNLDELREATLSLNKKGNRGTRKQDIIHMLLSSCQNGRCSELQSFILARTGGCVRISPLAEMLLWRVERLFFLNGEQDLSAFLLVDMGIVKYPAYNCIISEPIFSNRSDFLSYEESVEISQIMVDSVDENNSDSIRRCIEISASRLQVSFEEGTYSKLMNTFLSRLSPPWIYSKVVLLGVSFLERDKRYHEAISLLRLLLNTFISDGRRGYWTLRLSVDLEHLGCLEDSLQVAENGILDPWVRAGSKIALQRRVLRLGKPPRRWKVPSYSKHIKRKIAEVHIQGRPLNRKTGMKSVFYGEDGEQCGVEQLALQHYAGEGGWLGVHTESGIWLTIFGILLWDIIFTDVPNVFRNKFQTAPLDLETDCFYEARKSLIEAHLAKVQDGLAEEILITTWESHFGTSCRGVNWEKHSLFDLRSVVTCIGGSPLASICRHLAQDYRSWTSGMPDLLLWRFHDCYRGEAKLVEVKGPNDKLSEQQHAWLLVLMDSGFNVEVCKVTPSSTS